MWNKSATPLESHTISPELHWTGIPRTAGGEEDVIAKGLSCGRMSYLEGNKKIGQFGTCLLRP